MEVSENGLPPVIIHFRLGFSMINQPSSELGGTPMASWVTPQKSRPSVEILAQVVVPVAWYKPMNYIYGAYKVVPQFVSVQLVNITPITHYGLWLIYRTSYWDYNPTYNWGASPCM